jgi:hypothetical protein
MVRQIELVEDQTGNMDPRANFKLIIIQTELERFKFLVRSFLRARIKKVQYSLAVQCATTTHHLCRSIHIHNIPLPYTKPHLPSSRLANTST